MARHLDMSQKTVVRIWQAFGLQPHCYECFKISILG